MKITLNKLRTFDRSHLDKILKTKDKFRILKFLEEWGLCVTNKKIQPLDEYKQVWSDLYSYYDKLQLTRKIGLNSAYRCLA